MGVSIHPAGEHAPILRAVHFGARNYMRVLIFRRRSSTSLFWRAFGLNAAVPIAAGLLLAFSPFTVSPPITLGEASALVAGIAVMLLVDLALMRRSFAPLNTLAATMQSIDPLKPGQRVRPGAHGREVSELLASFNEMLDRLEQERA